MPSATTSAATTMPRRRSQRRRADTPCSGVPRTLLLLAVGEMDDGGRPAAGSAVDLQPSPDAFHAHPLRREADVAARKTIRKILRVEALAVVADDEDPLAVLVREPERDLARVRVLRGVHQELARDGDEQVLVRVRASIAEVAVEPKASAACRPPPDRRKRGPQSGLLEHVGMELEHGLAEFVHRLRERSLSTEERRVVVALAHLLELVPDRQEILDRVVVELLGEQLALALLGAERIREQALPHGRQLRHPL